MVIRARLPRLNTVLDQTITCNLLASTATFFNATVTSETSINANLLTSGETFFNATVSSQAFVNSNLLASTETFYLATLTGGSANIACDLIPSQETFFLPIVAQDDKNITLDLLRSTLAFPLLTVFGGITDTDFSDILTRKSRGAKRKRRQSQLDEENVAAQILRARQVGKEEIKPNRRKPFEIKIQANLAEPVSVIPSIEVPLTQEIDAIETLGIDTPSIDLSEVANVVEDYQKQQKRLKLQKQLHALLTLALHD